MWGKLGRTWHTRSTTEASDPPAECFHCLEHLGGVPRLPHHDPFQLCHLLDPEAERVLGYRLSANPLWSAKTSQAWWWFNHSKGSFPTSTWFTSRPTSSMSISTTSPACRRKSSPGTIPVPVASTTPSGKELALHR